MNSKSTRSETAQVATGREGLRQLLRRPLIQGMLVVTAAAQVVAVQGKERAASAGSEPVAKLEVMVVRGPAREVGGEDETRLADASAELAERYRERGFRVPDDLAEEIHEAALENDIDPDLAFGLVHAESGFRNVATSRVGAIGLTQLMPATARWLEPGVTRSELRDPETNLRIGFRYLKQLIEKYDGDVDLALTAYNRGPGTVDRALRRGRNPDNGYADFVRTGRRGRHRG